MDTVSFACSADTGTRPTTAPDGAIRTQVYEVKRSAVGMSNVSSKG